MRTSLVAALVIIAGFVGAAYPVLVVMDHVNPEADHEAHPLIDPFDEVNPNATRLLVLHESVIVPLPGGDGAVGFVVPPGYLELLVTALQPEGAGTVDLAHVAPDGSEATLREGFWDDDSPWRAAATPGEHRLHWSVVGSWSTTLRVVAQ